ncbi:MAG: hypothetical protein ACMUJM_18180 [bacterium]
MDKKDPLDDMLNKFYKHARSEIIPPRGECPPENTLWRYIHKELSEKETSQLEQHFISCEECWETLGIIRKIEESETSRVSVPEDFHIKARELLKKGSKAHHRRTKLILLWDRLHNTIAHHALKFGEVIMSERPEFQVTRMQELKEGEYTPFPYRTMIKAKRGKILIEINSSGNQDYLTLKISFHDIPRKRRLNLWARLSKYGRMYSSLPLDDKGEAFFHRIEEGDYEVQFLEGERHIEMIDISIISKKHER